MKMFTRTKVCVLAIFGTLFLFTLFAPVKSFRGYGRNKRSSGGPRDMKRQVTCNSTYLYRLIDGSCNNLDNVEYGMAGSPYRRTLDPVYNDDDGQTPRLKASDGADLPSPRLVSTEVHDEEEHFINGINLMTMQWGQFLDHDLTSTPSANSTEDCCYDDLVTCGSLHPDVTTGGPCFPFIAPDDDRYFNTSTTMCMEFVRSDPVTDSNNVRQQYNDITPWIDASQVYGHTDELAKELRSFTKGKLAVVTIDGEDFLPADTNGGCFTLEEDDYCFLAGDHRVNVFPGLMALHTIFLRYHNTLCDRLLAIHTDWDDETLYQEARRIVVAVTQSISYGEFMKQVLGSTNAESFNLLSNDDAYAYDSSIDPSLLNVFSTAAYRFGHSMVGNSMTIGGEVVDTGDLYLRPKYVLNSMKDVMQGILDEPSERTDTFYTEGMTDRLFEVPGLPGSGSDVVARNIQRGREHGLPPYNDWREHYGLARKASFDDMDSGGNKYSNVYTSVDDIDLYSGAISESTSTTGAKVGELYIQILGNQFRDLKFGDRFWFENENDVTSFTTGQIEQIRKLKLSKVICDTVPEFTQIQEFVFGTVNATTNPLVNCSSLHDIDIETFWA